MSDQYAPKSGDQPTFGLQFQCLSRPSFELLKEIR